MGFHKGEEDYKLEVNGKCVCVRVVSKSEGVKVFAALKVGEGTEVEYKTIITQDNLTTKPIKKEDVEEFVHHCLTSDQGHQVTGSFLSIESESFTL